MNTSLRQVFKHSTLSTCFPTQIDVPMLVVAPAWSAVLRVLCIRDTCRMGTCVLATDRARCVLRIRDTCLACTCVLRDGQGTVCASHPEHVRSGR